jgi:tetratricopeptide (TPR) repeat protein
MTHDRRAPSARQASSARSSRGDGARASAPDRPLGVRSLAAIGALALAARLVYLHVAQGAGLLEGLYLDGKYYADQAGSIRLGHGAGAHPFLLSPLYPYFLALFTDASGHLDASSVRLVQACFGSASSALAAWTAASICGRRAGWIAGISAAIYAPLIHMDACLLVASLQGFFLTLAVALLVLGDRWALASAPSPIPPASDRSGKPEPPPSGVLASRSGVDTEGRDFRRSRRIVPVFASAGIALGVAAGLHAASAAIALAVLAVAWIGTWISRPARSTWKLELARSAALLAGLAVVIAPIAIRNERASGELVLLSANGGMNFWIGNQSHADGLFHAPPGYDFANDPVGRALAEHDAGRKLSYGEASSWWTERALADVRADPVRWIGLVAKKLLLFGHSLEIPQLGESFAWARDRAWPLRSPIDARIVLLLALTAPLFVALARGGEALAKLRWPIVALAAHAGIIALFFVTGRYRAPILPTAVALAAAGVVALLELSFSARARGATIVFASWSTLLALGIASYFLYDSRDAPLFLAPTNAVEERHRGMSLYAQGRFAEAVEAYEQALASSDDPITRTNLANALKALGRFDEAADQYRRVLSQNPHDGVTWYDYGNLLRTHDKNYRGAAEAYRRAVDERPLMPEAHYNLGLDLLDLGEPEDAAAAIESSLSLAPPNAGWREQAEEALLVARTRAAQRNVTVPKDGAPKK